jgi:hypothetical protein
MYVRDHVVYDGQPVVTTHVSVKLPGGLKELESLVCHVPTKGKKGRTLEKGVSIELREFRVGCSLRVQLFTE